MPTYTNFSRVDYDMDIPECRQLRYSRRRARVPHLLGCGHVVQPGEYYADSAWIVDGEFVSFTGECDQCLVEFHEQQVREHAEIDEVL